LGHLDVCEDAAFEKLHNVERGANNGSILTKSDGTGDRNAEGRVRGGVLIVSVEGE
jgi:hypothetical protein